MRVEYAPMLDDKEGICEIGYLQKIFNNLNNVLDDDYLFVVGRTNTNNEEEQLYDFLKNKEGKLYYIYLSDEFGKIPSYTDKFIKLFRTYNRKDLYDNNKIYPIPCGFSSGHRNGWYNGETEKKHLKLREIDLFFSGQKSPNRNEFQNHVNLIKNNYKSIINFTDGFSYGYLINEYFEKLQNSKISLVPDGAVIPESFRFFESMESNCVSISTYPIKNNNYNHWYYDGCPAIFLNSWNDLNEKIIDKCLNNLEELHENTKNYYKNKLSSEAVANYILENL
jgi:hypothetical protein